MDAGDSVLLRGRCSCGRNLHTIHLPANASSVAQILFDDHTESCEPFFPPPSPFPISLLNHCNFPPPENRPQHLSLPHLHPDPAALDPKQHLCLLPGRNALEHPPRLHASPSTVCQAAFLWVLWHAVDALERRDEGRGRLDLCEFGQFGGGGDGWAWRCGLVA